MNRTSTGTNIVTDDLDESSLTVEHDWGDDGILFVDDYRPIFVGKSSSRGLIELARESREGIIQSLPDLAEKNVATRRREYWTIPHVRRFSSSFMWIY